MLLHRPRGRLAGVEIDYEALRNARLKAGLSLAQVGGNELTRQAVHLIETGKVRPSRRSLEVIAARLGIPASTLVVTSGDRGPAADDVQIVELEALSQRHEHVRVAERAEEILHHEASSRLQAFAHYYMGIAFYFQARLDEALEHQREAARLFGAIGNPWFVAEAIDWEAITLHLKESPQALDVAQDALRRYRELDPRRSETEARMLEHVGTILAGRREEQQAREHYDEALRVAGTMRDLARTGRIYHGLAVSYRGLGDLRRATDLLSRAVALYEAEHRMSPAPARIPLPSAQNDLGVMLMEQGDLGAAERLFLSALDHFTEAGVDRLRSHALLSLGELRQRQGRITEAFELVRQALDLAERLHEARALATGHRQMAGLHAELGEWEAAAGQFEAALAMLAEAGLARQRQRYVADFERLLEKRQGQVESRRTSA